ncbi:MAG: flagellin [Polyangiaceae bacterium]
MSIYLQTNVSSMVAEGNFNQNQMAIQNSFTQLSSGYRINSAADDAGMLGMSKVLNSQVQSYTVAARNTSDASSMVQTADGSAGQISDLLTRMRALAVEAQSGSSSAADVANMGTEFTADLNEIDRVAGDATFNGTALLAGAATTVNFQVGINGGANDQISVGFGGLDSTGLGVNGQTVNSANILTTLDSAMSTLNTARAAFGSTMNRLTYASNQIQSTSTNLASALSNIQDVDVAAESSDLAREQVLAQAGASVLSQANQSPQLALKLLQ